MKLYFVYILQCADDSFYIGMTNNLERRLVEHKIGKSGYTSTRLPVELVWREMCTNPDEAIKIEKQLKGWSRRKKKALIDERWDDLVEFSKNYTEHKNIRIKKPSSTGSD
jgi:putative endonuclease